MFHMNQPYIELNDGNRVPQIGLGVFQIPDGSPTRNACLSALECGYRHIDTAHAYGNERSVGEAVRQSGVPREEVFITSKLWPTEYGNAADGIDKMLKRLGTDYIDQVLLHQPVGEYRSAWKAMERAVSEGKVRSIGLSNFEGERLKGMLSECDIVPATLQVECHPFYQQWDLRERLLDIGTVITAWYPLGHGDRTLIDNALVGSIAKEHCVSNAQVILRWHIQAGNIVIPGSTNPEHIRDNLAVKDFQLSDLEMKALTSMDRGVRYYNVRPEQAEAIYLSWKVDD